MAKTPIIDIDLNAPGFDEFARKWEEYQASLKKMPEAFRALNERVAEFQKLQKAAGVDAGAALAAAVKMEGAVKSLGRAQQSNATGAERSAKAFKSMSKDVLNVGKGVLHITKSLVKWGSIIGGIGAGVGLFGIDKLAGSALEQQRGARGMNVSIGQAAAMKVNMSRFFSPDAAMSTVANAQQNYARWGDFAALGLNPAEVANRGTFGATLEVAQAARRAWMQYHNAAMPQVQAAERLGFSVADLRRMAASPNFEASIARTRTDVNSLGIRSRVASEWSALSVQLSRAGRQIENTLITGLAPLAPDLRHLSVAINQDLIQLLKSPELKKAIHGLGGWIGDAATEMGKFAKFIASPQFQGDMQTFGNAIAQLSREVVNALHYFGLIPNAKPTYHALKTAAAKHVTPPSFFGSLAEQALINKRRHLGDYTPAHLHALNVEYAKKFGVPLGIADRLTYDESGYGQHLISPKGAVGPDQLMGPTAKALGVTNRASARQNIRGGLEYVALMKKHFGSWRKAVAAANWGPGNLEADIRAHGAAWAQYLPNETKGEVYNVTGGGRRKADEAIAKMLRMAKQKQAQSNKYVTITNATAAHVAVSANAVAP